MELGVLLLSLVQLVFSFDGVRLLIPSCCIVKVFLELFGNWEFIFVCLLSY